MLESSRVHLLKFSSVDSTMRLADAFVNNNSAAKAYTSALAEHDILDNTNGSTPLALAFQADC